MATLSETPTSVTLLVRLSDGNDEEVWCDFVQRYAPAVFTWCRRYSLQENDAADVTQNVLIKVLRAMRANRYDASKGSFRAWLKTVTGNAVRDLMRTWDDPVRGCGDTEMTSRLATIRDPKAVEDLSEELEAQHKQELLRQGEREVRCRVRPHTWQAYHLSAVERVPAKEVARRVGMRVGEVYVANRSSWSGSYAGPYGVSVYDPDTGSDLGGGIIDVGDEPYQLTFVY